jgi:hypothetical protein
MLTTLWQVVRRRAKKYNHLFFCTTAVFPKLLCPDTLFRSLPLIKNVYYTQSENASLRLETTFREFLKYLWTRLYPCGAPTEIVESVCKHATTREMLTRYSRTLVIWSLFLLYFVIRFQMWLHRTKIRDALHDLYASLRRSQALLSTYLSELNMFLSSRFCRENLHTFYTQHTFSVSLAA